MDKVRDFNCCWLGLLLTLQVGSYICIFTCRASFFLVEFKLLSSLVSKRIQSSFLSERFGYWHHLTITYAELQWSWWRTPLPPLQQSSQQQHYSCMESRALEGQDSVNQTHRECRSILHTLTLPAMRAGSWTSQSTVLYSSFHFAIKVASACKTNNTYLCANTCTYGPGLFSCLCSEIRVSTSEKLHGSLRRLWRSLTRHHEFPEMVWKVLLWYCTGIFFHRAIIGLCLG